MNLAENVEAYRAGKHPGWVETAWAGLEDSIEVISERKIKVVINGGSLNPSGLAIKVALLVIHRRIVCFSADELLGERKGTSPESCVCGRR